MAPTRSCQKTFKTKGEAKRWALENELVKAKGIDLAEQTTTFAEFYEHWLYTVKRGDIRETTFQNYEKVLSFVKSSFKNIQLKDLNDIIVQKIIDKYDETHSRKTTHELLKKIRTALRDAYARGYLTNDFTSLLKIRGKELPKRNKPLSITDTKKLRNYLIENVDDEFNILVLLALETGMRRGELLGIRKEDLFEGQVMVKRSISPTTDDTSLKTKNSERGVSITTNVFEIVKAMPTDENGYIFTQRGIKQSGQLAELLGKLEIEKTTFHGLRDTHASFLFSQDIDLIYVSKRLGHDSILTTQKILFGINARKKASARCRCFKSVKCVIKLNT